MPRLPDDQGEGRVPFLPEARRVALTTALREHRAALVALASAVCEFARELHASGETRDEILIAVREHLAEFQTLNASVLEEEGDDEVLDAMVDSCLDDWADERRSWVIALARRQRRLSHRGRWLRPRG